MPTYYAPGENSAAAIQISKDETASKVRISHNYIRPGRPKGPPRPKKKSPPQRSAQKPFTPQLKQNNMKRTSQKLNHRLQTGPTPSPLVVTRSKIRRPVYTSQAQKAKPVESNKDEVMAYKEWMSGPLSPTFQARQAALVGTIDEMNPSNAMDSADQTIPSDARNAALVGTIDEMNPSNAMDSADQTIPSDARNAALVGSIDEMNPSNAMDSTDQMLESEARNAALVGSIQEFDPIVSTSPTLPCKPINGNASTRSLELNSTKAQPEIIRVDPCVEAAREAFDKTFEKLFHKSSSSNNSERQSEYDLNYTWLKPPQPVKGKAPSDSNIFEFANPVGDNKDNTIQVPVPPEIPGWMRSSPEELGKELEQYQSEEMREYKIVQEVIPHVRASKRPDSLDNNCSIIENDTKVQSRQLVERLRKEFTEEMSRLHRTDIPNEFVSEYDRSFASPVRGRLNTLETCEAIVGDMISDSISRVNVPSDQNRTTYQASYSQSELQHIAKTVSHKWDHHSFLSSGMIDNPPEEMLECATTTASAMMESEYDSSFKPYEERSKNVPQSLSHSNPRSEFVSEYQQRFKAPNMIENNVEEIPKRRFENIALYQTEYQASFDRSRKNCTSIPQPFQSPNESSEKLQPLIEPIDPTFVTVYQDAFERHHDGGLPDDTCHVMVDQVKPVSPFYITEYQRAFELEQVGKAVKKATGASTAKTLKPFYSMEPKTKHKHKLFKSEMVRGFVPKSEYMAKYPDYSELLRKAKAKVIRPVNNSEANSPPRKCEDILQMTA